MGAYGCVGFHMPEFLWAYEQEPGQILGAAGIWQSCHMPASSPSIWLAICFVFCGHMIAYVSICLSFCGHMNRNLVKVLCRLGIWSQEPNGPKWPRFLPSPNGTQPYSASFKFAASLACFFSMHLVWRA